MTAGITKEDRLLLVGEAAWHGLGTVIPRDSAPNVREGFRRTVPWEPRLIPIVWDRAGVATPVPDSRGIVADYGPVRPPRFLSTVGADYKLVSHEQLLMLAEAAEALGSEVKLETVGTTNGGRRIFLLLRVGRYGVGLNREDETSTYFALLNSYDGSTALRGFGTEVRIVCKNTFGGALTRADSDAVGFRIAHNVPDMDAAIEMARKAIGAGRLQLANMEAQANVLADTPLRSATVAEYFGRVSSVLFPAVATERPSDPTEAEAWERQRARAKDTVGKWMEELEHERQALVAGTAYAALEAVTHWADHGRPRVREGASDKLLGRGARIKFQARELALQLVGADEGSVPPPWHP